MNIRKDRRNGLFTKDSKTGKYLGKFTTHEEAQKWSDEFRNTTLRKWNGKYVRKDLRKGVDDMLRELAAEGIRLHRHTLYKWMRIDEQIAYIPRRKSDRKHKLVKTQFRLSEDIVEVLNTLPNKSNFVEWGVRMMFGMPCQDVLITHYRDGRSVLYIQRPTDIQLILFDTFSETEVNALQSLAAIAQENGGLTQIKRHAESQGLRWFGGNT